MKVLFSCAVPFFLAHGGSQTLTEALMRELQVLGLEVEPARCWDGGQKGDLLHYIGRPSTLNVRLAQAKGFKVVMTDLLDQTASRSKAKLLLQRGVTHALAGIVPRFTSHFNWEVYREIDAMVYAVPHEWEVAQKVFKANPKRGRVIPHGLEATVIEELGRPQKEEDYLISVATIDSRKKSVLLAEAARMAQVPVLFLGKPYSASAPYFQRFQNLVDNRWVRYAGFVSSAEKYRLLRGSRGFVLLSRFESGCIAVFEAAAAGLPLLLSDLPWAKKSYPEARALSHAPLRNLRGVVRSLEQFYRHAHRAPEPTFPILSWNEIARQYLNLYREICAPLVGR